MTRSRVLLAIATLLVLLAGCAVGPSERPPIATRSDDGPPPAVDDAPADPPPPPLVPPLVASTAPGIAFTDCTGEARAGLGADVVGPGAASGRDLAVECGTLTVAGRGAAGPAELSVVRVTAAPLPPGGPGPLVPLVAVGEPGGAVGSDEAVRIASSAPGGLLDGNALYGVDLRGTGGSEPVDCLTPSTREAITDADPLAADPAALGPLNDAAATAARTCTQILETGLTDYRTGVSAEDLDQVRAALAVPHMHAVGLGDGASAVAEWSRRYPQTVGRTVLDGAGDPTTPTGQRAEERSVAARVALEAFAADCTARPGCPLGADPTAVVAAVEGVMARLRTAPLIGVDGRRITDGTATHALVTGLERPEDWPATADALAAAGQGEPSGLLALLAPREIDGGGFDIGLISRCNDSQERLTLGQIATTAERLRRSEPLFGAFFAQQAVLCTAWPVPTDVLTLPEGGGPPSLAVGTEGDARTPLAATRRVAGALDDTSLVTWLGAAHGAYPGTPCVDRAVGQYLLGGTLPREGTVCPP